MHKHIATLTVGRIINSIVGHMNDTHFKMIKICEMIDDLRIFGGIYRQTGKEVRSRKIYIIIKLIYWLRN